MKDCFFVANNSLADSGMSGGDRIYIELARYWKEKTKFAILGCQESINICRGAGLSDVKFYMTSPKIGLKEVFSLRSLFFNFFKRVFHGSRFVLKNRALFNGEPIVYSVSDFYPDAVPAFLIKLLRPKSLWVAAFFLFAPAPWLKNSPYRGRQILRGFLYWISQKPMYWIINTYADFVFVTSEPDKKRFVTKKRDASKVFVIKGGVDIRESSRYLSGSQVLPVDSRRYDACFIGRFHFQKGVLALLDIWKEVVVKRPGARLAMIGDGPLEDDVRKKVREYQLENYVDLLGFLDGEEKFAVFKQSKVVLHPALFDSGGMAAAEAMAWALPAVGFDLEALKTYYSRGMVKVPQGNYKKFADEILRLLIDQDYYTRLAEEARLYIVQEWDWHRRAEMFYARLTEGA